MNDRPTTHSMSGETASDFATPSHVTALGAVLDYLDSPSSGEALPPLWHWIFFQPQVAQSSIAEDGHPRKAHFLLDMKLPRRMWAGGRLKFVSPVIVGKELSRESRIIDISEKSGRSGRLGFVTIGHRVVSNGVFAVDEEQDVVYREPAARGVSMPVGIPALEASAWERVVVPDEILLFRYSALTFNAHRIHYDKPYATAAEGYPGLVVHGPLIATLLVDLIRRHLPEARVLSFSFKAIRPCFAGDPLYLRGDRSADGKVIELWSHDNESRLCMTATAILA
jgi:3-methylfumaryl-CoA hydratase